MPGLLICNQDRPDIALDTGSLYSGLHCGDCFRCLITGDWIDVRLEYSDRWMLVHNGCHMPVYYDVKTRISKINPPPIYSSSSRTSPGLGDPDAM